MTRTQQINLIHEAYSDLSRLNLQDGFFEVNRRLLQMNSDSERRHRRGAPCGIRHGITVKNAAMLFTVSHLLDGWNEPTRFSVNDILSIRSEVLFAQAYAARHHKELADWAAKYTEPFKQVDYADLQKI